MRRLGEDFGEAKLTKLRERLTARRHTSPTRSMRSQGLAVLTRGVCSLRGALGPTACGAGTLNGRLRNMAESRAWPLMAWLRFAACSTQAEVTLEGEDRNTRSLLRDMKKQTGLSEASMAFRPPAHFPSDITRDYPPSLLISQGITLLPF